MRAADQLPGAAESVDLRERARALGALRAAFDDGLAGAGRVVFVGGEAGVGKSALLRRFARGTAWTRNVGGLYPRHRQT